MEKPLKRGAAPAKIAGILFITKAEDEKNRSYESVISADSE